MSKRIKTLSLGALVALAMAVNVSSASAVVAKFSSEKYPAELTGTQTAPHTFATVAGVLTCGAAKFTGTLAEKSTTVTVAPTYEMCNLVGKAAAVAVNGCKYKFEAGAMEGENEAVGGGLEITCEGANKIVVTAGECVMKIPPTGESVGFVDFKNLAGGEFEAIVKVVLTYTVNNKCGVAEGEYKFGNLNGNYKVAGNNGPVGVAE